MGAASKIFFTVAGLQFGPSGPARGRGCLFPLPFPAALTPTKLSEDAPPYLRNRHLRRRLHHQRARGSVSSLNELNLSCCQRDNPRASGSSWSPARPQASSAEGARISRARASALRHILAQRVKNRPPAGVAKGQEALSELLKCRSPYSLETARVAKHNLLLCNVLRRRGRLGLVPLGGTLSGDEALWWREWKKYILLPELERYKALEDGAVPEPYWDPDLRRGGPVYSDFILRLREAGLVGFRRRVKILVGVFFCKEERRRNTHDN